MKDALTLFLQSTEQLIQLNQLEKVIEYLLEDELSTQAGIRDDIILQAGSFNGVAQMYRDGVLTDDRYFQMTAKTRANLLQIVRGVPRKLEINAKLKGLGTYQLDISDKEVSLEKVISSKDNLLTISWVKKAVQFSKTVCRVVLPDDSGTGFLTKEGYLFTNNHVITSPEVARSAYLEFNYEVDADGKTMTYKLDASDFITSPPTEYDFTRVKVIDNPDNPIKQWGYVDFAPEMIPSAGAPVSIIQHPRGGDKRIALRANEVVAQQNQHLFYTTDTEPGSSGSPVFNNEWKVIALHHGANKIQVGGATRDVNEGVLFRDIFAFIAKSGK